MLFTHLLRVAHPMAEKRIRIEESRGKLGVLLICEVPSAPPLPGGGWRRCPEVAVSFNQSLTLRLVE